MFQLCMHQTPILHVYNKTPETLGVHNIWFPLWSDSTHPFPFVPKSQNFTPNVNDKNISFLRENMLNNEEHSTLHR